MKQLSDLLENPTKPDPDITSNWVQSDSTQWLIKKLYIEYHELSESLEDLDGLSNEEVCKQLHVSQGGLRSIRFVIDLIEDMK